LTTLQVHGTESGKPSGALKITEVPELPKQKRRKPRKLKATKIGYQQGLQFFTEKSRHRR
jgi:hypothetical protein